VTWLPQYMTETGQRVLQDRERPPTTG